MTSAGNISELGYGVFYLPPVSFGYLYSVSNGNFNIEDPFLNFPLFVPSYVLLIATGFTLIGAIEIHGIARSIFGPAGPEDAPKDDLTVTRSTIALILNIPVDQLPYSSSTVDLVRAAFELDETNMRELVYRYLRFFPADVHYYSHIISGALIFYFVFFSRTSVTGGFLLLAHTVFFARSYLWAPLPTIAEYETLRDYFVADHEKTVETFETTSSKRLNKNTSNGPSRMYRE